MDNNILTLILWPTLVVFIYFLNGQLKSLKYKTGWRYWLGTIILAGGITGIITNKGYFASLIWGGIGCAIWLIKAKKK